MEASYYCTIKTHPLCSSLSIPKTKFCSIIPPQPIPTQKLSFSPLNRRPLMAAIGCAKVGPVTEFDRELEEEMKGISGEEDEWVGIGGRWRDKCEGGGIVELLEYLEKEAIMGEDKGREPTDYHRRAHIFDKSSRVFQALKESDAQKS